MKELLLKPAVLTGSPPNGETPEKEGSILWVVSVDRYAIAEG